MAEFSSQVLLLGNYPNDQQESMQRFAGVLFDELRKRSISVEMIRPEPAVGRLVRGGAGLGKWCGYIDKFLLFPRHLKRRLGRFQRGDVLHICDHSNAVYTRHAADVPHLVTCHDLLAIRSALGEIPENKTGSTGRIYQRMIRNGLNRAQRVACVSKSTERDLRRLTTLQPIQVGVVYNGLNYPYRPMERAEAMSRIARKIPLKSGRFILHVGGNQWYKNRRGVVQIYSELVRQLPDAPRLILAGKKWTDSLRQQISDCGLQSKITEAVSLDNEDLRALYSAAEALLFPSLMEGFGWPIIEAQACGCPVATSNRAPMSEIASDAAIYIDPADVRAAASALCALICEDEKARAVRRQNSLANAALFSVDRMIDGYIAEYAALGTT